MIKRARKGNMSYSTGSLVGETGVVGVECGLLTGDLSGDEGSLGWCSGVSLIGWVTVIYIA